MERVIENAVLLVILAALCLSAIFGAAVIGAAAAAYFGLHAVSGGIIGSIVGALVVLRLVVD